MKRIALAILLAAGGLTLLQPAAIERPHSPGPAAQAAGPAATIVLAQSVPCPNGRCAR